MSNTNRAGARLRRAATWLVALMLLVALGGALAGTRRVAVANEAATSMGSGAAPKLIRDGTIATDLVGRFIAHGERTIFRVTATHAEFRILENLSLERVAAEIAASSEGASWKINGLVTEYRGANYLLIERAVMQNTRRSSLVEPR